MPETNRTARQVAFRVAQLRLPNRRYRRDEDHEACHLGSLLLRGTLSLFAMVRAMEPARLAQKLHSAELAVLDLCLGWIVLVGVGWLFTPAAWTLANIRDCA